MSEMNGFIYYLDLLLVVSTFVFFGVFLFFGALKFLDDWNE